MVSASYFVTTIFILLVLVMITQGGHIVLRKDDRLSLVQFKLSVTIIIFCVIDTFWGILGSKVWFNPTAFFVVSTLFHVGLGLVSLMWLEFVLEYLDEFIVRKTMYRSMAGILVTTQYILLIANIWVPVVFSVDELGDYHFAILRMYTLWTQNIIYIGTGVLAVIAAIRAKNKMKKKRMNAVFVFVLAPLISGFFQSYFPEYPLHTLGYALGCLAIHGYITMEASKAADAEERDEMRLVLKALTNNYDIICQFNLDTGEEKVYRNNDVFVNDFNKVGQLLSFEEKVRSYAEKYIVPISQQTFIEQMDADIIWEQVKNGKEYVIQHLDVIRSETLWYETRVIRAAGVGLERAVLVSYRNINDEVIAEKKRQRDELKKEKQLIRLSNTDELTGFLNRHAYSEYIKNYEAGKLPSSLTVVSFDINGLKDVNDTLGHSAGDELIKGAATCIRQCFGSYGNVYRVGGDEFIAVLTIKPGAVKVLISDFEQTTAVWEGKEVSNLSVALGYAIGNENPDISMLELTNIADSNMYLDKTKKYDDRGIDRKGKLTALNVLCGTYSKIIKVDLKANRFGIIQMLPEEKEMAEKLNGDYTAFVQDVVDKKLIHPDDVEIFMNKMDLNYLVPHFLKPDNSYMYFYYCRFEKGKYIKVVLEILKSKNFSEDQMEVFMYVKAIDND